MVGGDGAVVTERTILQLPFVGIGWCELHQRASSSESIPGPLILFPGIREF